MEADCKHQTTIRRFLQIQFAITSAAFLVAAAWLSPIERGWDWEPLCWLAIFWYGLFEIGMQMAMSRCRISIRSLVVLTTCCVLLIGFPFSSIRKATVRARNAYPGRATAHYGWLKLNGWRRLPQGDLLPCCLHWRLPEGFEYPQTEIAFEDAAKLVDAPQLLRDEVAEMEMSVDAPLKADVIAKAVAAIQRMPNLRTMHVDSEHSYRSGAKNRGVLDMELQLPQLRRLQIRSYSQAPELCGSLLSSENLVELQIYG